MLVAGPHVSPGYWEDPAATAESFGAQASTDDSRRYLRTGDIGVLRGGRLTISGRIKHIVIIRSVKHHAEDVEASVGRCHPALENGGTAAFAADAARGEELIVLQEVGARRLEPAMLEEIRAMIAAVLAEEHGVKAGEIVLVPRWSLPRTSSGKLMRAQCRAAHAAGSLRVLVAPAAVVTA